MNAIDGSSAPRTTPAYRPRGRCPLIIVALVIVLAAGAVAVAAQQEDGVAGLSREEALRLGERMYREGILPSGEPMRAFVQQDIEVDGTMFSCQSCHVRSGMGSREGTVITYPTCGSWLFKPLVGAEMKPESQARVPSRLDPPPFRPAYTDASLARAIRLGKDPNDRVLSWVMPRYQVSGTDMDILVYYLKNLSATWSPGVDDTTIRFATVVGPDVPEVDRKAMLDALDVQVRVHNSQMRHDERRAKGGPFYKEEKYSPYRRFSLSVWQLEGAPESWPAQLDAYYEKEPVFAMLAGITTGEWAPIHEFAERRQIPCLFPITDYPVVSDTDWYTVYYSKGYYQEGDAAAHFLRRAENVPGDAQVLQIFRGDRASRDLAAGFRDGRRSMRLPPAVDLELGADTVVDAAFWRRLAAANPGAVLAVWLGAGDLQSLEALTAAEPQPPMVFLSSTMMGDAVTSLPEAVRGFTYLTCPHSFPDDNDRAQLVVESWVKARGMQLTNFDIQAKMYFLEWTLAPLVKMMRDDFYRDYFLDILDMMRDQYYSIAVYPRLSFGPGQRYASKGCYIAQLTGGEGPTLEKRSTWVIH